MNRLTYLILFISALCTVACYRSSQNSVDPLSLGVDKKVRMVVTTANQLGRRTSQPKLVDATIAKWKPLFSELGYMVVIPRLGKALTLSLDDFAKRCQDQHHHYTFDRATVNHYSNFEPGVGNKYFADNQVYHDVKEFTLKGKPIATRESFVKQPFANRPADDFWQIYILSVHER